MSNLPPYNITNTSNGTSLNKTARYVFIILETVNQSLLMNEVEIYDENGTNIALNKTAIQSNTPETSYPASKAVDGGTTGLTYSMTTWDARGINSNNTGIEGNGIEDENGDAHNWWGVDLGSDTTISRIRIYGHDYPAYLENGSEWSRHAPHRIQVYTTSEYSNYTFDNNIGSGDGPISYENPYLRYINDCNLSSDNNNTQQILDYVSNAISNEITNYSTNTGFKEAQYMFIQLETENTDMNYSEIEIYDENGTNIALNLATGSYVQSSNLDTNNTYPASYAFNNNNVEYEFHHTSSGTGSGEREWLGINLGSNKKIAGIRVYGRIDSNLAYIEGGSAYARTAPFRIFLYTSDEYTGTFADGYDNGPLNYNDYSLHSDDATINKTINNQQVFYYGIVITSDTYINNRNKSIADIKYNNLPPYNITITHSITQNHEAQYFFIQLETENTYMQYAEIKIYDENSTNIALNLATSSYARSSNHANNSFTVDKAFDDDLTTTQITYLNTGKREWLGVNFGSNKKISGIRVYGRIGTDYIEGGSQYASTAPFRIFLYTSDEYTGTFADGYNNGPLDYNDYSLHSIEADTNQTINANQQHFLFDLSQQPKIRTPDYKKAITNYDTTDGFKEAQFFFIQLETAVAMCYSEIEIYDPYGNNIALSKDAVQTSTYSSFTASKAVNGIIDPYNRSEYGDFQHTNGPSSGNTRDWLGINLGSDQKIAGIRIYSGNYPYSVDGGYATRTEPFRIYLYTSSEYTGSFASGYLNGPLDYDNYHLHSDDAINKRIDNLKLFYYGITPTIESGNTIIGKYAFYTSNLISITIPNSVTTIGEYAFKDSRLTSVNIPNSVTSISNYAFYGNPYLDDITLHKLKNDDINNNNIIGLSGGGLVNKVYTTNVFSNIKRDATFTLFSNEKMDIESYIGEYRYVFYERDSTTGNREASMVRFEVWDENNNRISSVNTGNPTVLFSSRWWSTDYDENHIKDDDNSHIDGEWHSRYQFQDINDVFGNTSGYKKPFIGYDFGFPRKMSKIVLTSCPDAHINLLSGDSGDRENRRNGYKLYFTNHIHKINHVQSYNYAPSTNVYTCVDPNEDYAVRTSYDDAIFNDDFTNNTYTHYLQQFKYRYKIIDGITSIAANEFKDVTNLLSIDFSNNITTIGNNAFEGTTNMTSFTLPTNASFTTIPDYCFSRSGLTSITIPDNITTFGNNAFEGTTNMTSFTLPTNASFTTIPDYCFSGSGLTSITIPDNITTISNNAFYSCSYLDDITLQKYKNDNIDVNNIIDLNGGSLSNKVYTTNVFNNIKRDATFTLFSDERMDIKPYIGEFQYVFYERQSTTGEKNAAMVRFEVWDASNNRISSVNTGNPTVLYSSTWLGYDQNRIKNDDNSHINGEWHSEASKQTVRNVFGYTNTSGYKNVFIGYNFGFARKMSKIVLFACNDMHDVSLDGESTDRDNKQNGYKLYFTNNVISVSTSDPTSHTPGTYTCVDPNGDYIVHTSYDQAIFNNDGDNNTYTHNMEQFKYRYKIIDGITSIAANEFKDTNLLSIDISNNVTTIGNNAFEGTTILSSCTLPINDNFTTIPDYCFSRSGLTSITIPDNITTFGNNAFEGTTNITSFTLPTNASFTTIPDYCFSGSGLTSITIPNSVTTIGNDAFEGTTNMTSFTFPTNASFTSISHYCFSGSGLTSITIPNSVTSIGNGAFVNTALTSITIPNNVTAIGSEAFRSCSNLSSFKLPNNPSFTTIPNDCFKNSLNWDSAQSIPHSVSVIGSNAFYSDTTLTNNAYLKLPPSFKDYVQGNTGTIIDTNKFSTDKGLFLVYNHFNSYKINNNNNNILQFYDGNDTQLTFANYNIFGNDIKYFKENMFTGSTNYSNGIGNIGYKYNNNDIGLQISPFYNVYTASVTTAYTDAPNSDTTIPGYINNYTCDLKTNFTRIAILAIGGGGGGGNGSYPGPRFDWYQVSGGAGGGSGGSIFSSFTRNDLQSKNGGTVPTQLSIGVGQGGRGSTGHGFGPTDGAIVGRKGSYGSKTNVKVGNVELVSADGGMGGAGGWANYDYNTTWARNGGGGNWTTTPRQLQGGLPGTATASSGSVTVLSMTSNNGTDNNASYTYVSGGTSHNRGIGYGGEVNMNNFNHTIHDQGYGKGGNGGYHGAQSNLSDKGLPGNGGVVVIFQYFT